jgi:uncharacterized protein YlxW (UPF0749 family)
MTEDQRPGAPDPVGNGARDDDVVPHPFGTGAPVDPAAGRPTASGRSASAGSEPGPGTSPAPEPAPAPEPPPAAGPAPEPAAPEQVTAAAVVEPAAEQPAAAEPAAVPDPAAAEPAAAAGAPVAPRPRRDPLAAVLIGLLTMLLGFAFAVQVRTVGDDTQLAGAREEDLVRILDELDAQEERLREQLAEQRSALEQLTNSDSRAATALEAARERAEAIGILNGTVPAQGPGLRIVIRDPEGRVRVADLLDAIQELRGAGAETMQIDDVRVGVSTAVTGGPGNLMIDGRPITTPYEILVIGSPQDMQTAMNIPGGVVQRISRVGSVEIVQSDEVVVDALRPLDTPQYASPQTGN